MDVNTSCKSCCFATYQGDTQTGCSFGRIEKFRAAGVEVAEAQDDEKEFYLVKGVCLLHRDRRGPWAEQFPAGEREAQARREVSFKVHVLVLVDGDLGVGEAKLTVDGLLAQGSPPHGVTVVVNRPGLRPVDITALLPPNWNALFIKEGGASRGRAIDLAVSGMRGRPDAYAVFTAGAAVPPDFVARLDRAVNDDLVRFILLEPGPRGQGLVVRLAAHDYYGGNAPATVVEGDGADVGKRADSIVEKVMCRARAEGPDAMRLVRKVGELCPRLG